MHLSNKRMTVVWILLLVGMPVTAWAWTPTAATLADVEPYHCGEDWQRNRREWRPSSAPILMDRLLLYTESLHPYTVAGVVVWRLPGLRFLGFFSPAFGTGPGQVTIELGGIPLLPGEWVETWFWCGSPVRDHPLNVFAILYYREP